MNSFDVFVIKGFTNHYMHFVCIFNNYVSQICYIFIQLPVKLLFIKKTRITEIDSNENINLLKNDRKFETLHFPKCLY